MNFKELALAFDAQSRPVEAAWAYEIATSAPDSDLDLFLNLAVLYFECADFGYASHHHLSESFVQAAWKRAFEILKQAEARFTGHSEIEFWRLYFPAIYLDEEFSDQVCKNLAQRNDSLIPYMYLFISSGKTAYVDEAQRLLELVADGATERKRYIKSIIEP